MNTHSRRQENLIKASVLLGYQRMHPEKRAFKVSWTMDKGFRVLNAMNEIIEQFNEKDAVKYLEHNKKYMKAGDIPVGSYYVIEGKEDKVFIKNYTKNKDFINDSFVSTYGTYMCRILSTAEKNAIVYAANGWTS